jgi:hypothetical protein
MVWILRKQPYNCTYGSNTSIRNKGLAVNQKGMEKEGNGVRISKNNLWFFGL